MRAVLYVLQRLHRASPDALPAAQWLRGVGDGDGWEWTGDDRSAHAWRVETDAQMDELETLAKQRNAWLVVRGTREVAPPGHRDSAQSTTTSSLAGDDGKPRRHVEQVAEAMAREFLRRGRRVVTPEEAFHELERRHLD